MEFSKNSHGNHTYIPFNHYFQSSRQLLLPIIDMTGTTGLAGRTYLPATFGSIVTVRMVTNVPRSQLLGQTMTSRKASILGLLCLLLLHTQSTANAQYVTDGDISGGEASGTLYSAIVPLAFPRSFLFARGDFGDRPGVEDSYFEFGGFMPMQFHGPDEVFFLEGSAWITEDDSSNVSGGTFGIGQRWLVRDFSQVVGINAFAAWDTSNNGYSYDGAGVGVEWFSDYLGVTANAYIPWNNDRINALGAVTPDKDSAFFQGSNLAFRAFQPVEEQVAGFDVEVGSAIPRAEFLSAYVGGYYFDAEEGNEFSGVSGRIQMDMTNAIVNVTVSNDDRFGTTVNVGGEIRLGDGPLNFAPRSRNLDRQMFDRARRRSRIATTTYDAQTVVIATRPDDGSPNAGLAYEFLHVDNDLGSLGGDGSFDDRFSELNQASNMPAADFILVYNGTTGPGAFDPKLTANGGLFLEDNQIVIGEGYDGFLLETAQFPGEFCPLPGFGTAGENPYITGDVDANLINLANNNRILGLNLMPERSGAAPGVPLNVGNAIFGENITVTSSTASPFIDQINKDIDLTTDSTGSGGGIRLENVAGVAVITDSGFNIDNTDASGGVVVDNEDTADLDISIINDLMTFPDLAYNGGNAGISLSGDNSNINATIEGVNSTGSLNGLEQNTTAGANVDVTVTDSNFTGAVEDNFNAMIEGGTSTTTITNTSLADAGQDAIDIFADNGADYTLTLDGSSGDNANDNGILAMIQGGSNVTLTATDSTFDMAMNAAGIDVTVTENSDFTGTITNGSFDDAGTNAVALDVQDAGSVGSLTLVNTSGSGAGEDAININASDASLVNNAIANLTLTNSTDFADAMNDGLEIMNTGATVNVTADSLVDFSNFVNGSGLNSMSTGSGADTNITFAGGASFDNTMGNAAGDAIFIQSDDGADTTLTGTAISGENAGDDGIDLNSDGGSITATITEAGSFANAGQNPMVSAGIEIENLNAGNIELNLTGAGGGIVDFSGAANEGLFVDGDGAGTLTNVNFNTGADLSDVGDDAIMLDSQGGAVTNVNGINMVGTNAGANAIDLIADGTDSEININFLGTNDFSDAALAGISSINTDGGLIDVAIGDADFSDLAGGQVGMEGLLSIADGANTSSTFTFNTGASFNEVGLDAIALLTSDGAANTLQGANLSGTGAGGDGIVIVNTGAADSTTTVTLTGTNDFSGATTNGLNSFNDAGDVNVNIGDADFSAAAGGNGIFSIATGDTADSTFTFNTGANFNDAGGDAIALGSLAGGTNTFTGDSVSGANAGFDAINLIADGPGSDIQLTMTNSTDFTNSGEDGLDFTVTDMANIDINLSGVDGMEIDFSDTDGLESGFGVLGNVTDGTATLTLNEALFNETLLGGLQVNVTDSTFAADIDNTEFNNSEGTGIEFNATDSEFNANIADTMANDANGSGVVFNLDNVTGNPIVLDTIEAMNAGQGDMTGDENALTINILGGGDNEFDIDSFIGDNAFNNGFEINVTEASTLTFDFDNSSFANAGRNAAEWNADGNSSIFSTLAGTFDTIDLSGAGQQGAAVTMVDDGDALQINATNTSVFGIDPGMGMLITSNIKFDNSDLSGAADNAMDFMLDGTSEVFVHVDPTDLTGAGSNGVEFDVLGGSTLTLQITDGSDISTAGVPVGENGIFGLIDGQSTVNLLVDNSNIANDGDLAGAFDAINISATDASTLNLDINNVDLTGWSDAGMTMGNGVVLNLEDSNADVTFAGTNTDISNAGNNAIEINATSGASANQTGSVVMLDLGNDGLMLDGAGNTGLVLNADGTGSSITVDGDDVSASGTGNLGFDLSATDGATIGLTGFDNLGINGWTADGNATGGLSIFAEGAGSSVFGTVNDLNTINNGAAGTDGSFGIQVTALDDAAIGNRAVGLTGTAGLIFNNATSGNFDAMGDPDFGNLTQDHAMILDVDDDAFANLTFNNAQFDANEERGVIIQTNEINADANETALAVVLFNGGSISNNGGDGVFLVSDQADVSSNVDPDVIPQSGGINAQFQNIDIIENSNNFPQPVDTGLVPDAGADGDSNGFGIFAQGGGADTPVTPGLININLDNVDLSDNEEGELVGTNVNGDIINISFNNMNLNTPIQICADMSDITQSFNNITISGLTGDEAAISILADNGFTANVSFSNITIEDVAAQAIAMLSQNGGEIIADFNGLTIDNAGYGVAGTTFDDKTGLLLEGVIQGQVNAGSTMSVDLAGVTIMDSGDGPGTGINVNAVDFDVDGAGAMLDLDISPDAPLAGLTVVGGATTAGNEAGAPALEGEIDVQLTGGAQATINLDDINIDDSDSLGINLTDDDDAAGGFTITGLNDIQANNAQAGGLNLVGNIIDNGMGGTPTEVSVTDSSFNDAGQGTASDGINIDLDFAGDGALNLTNVNANNATNGGVDILLTGDAGTTTLDVTLNTVNANDAMAGDGLEIDVNGLVTGANSNVAITGSSFNNSGGVNSDGIDINFDGALDATATVDVTMTNATGAGDDGFDLLEGVVDVTSVNLNTVDFSNAGDVGANIDIGPQAVDAVVTIDTLTANDTAADAVNITLIDIDANTTTTLSNIIANNTDPMTFTGGGIDINLTDVNDPLNAGTHTVTIDNVSAQGAVGRDGLNITAAGLDADETLAITIGGNSNFSGNEMGGVLIDVEGTDTTLIELDVDGVTANNNLMGDGFNFATTMGEDVDILNFANITTTGNSQDGIDLSFAGGTGSIVTFDGAGTFESIVSTNNDENGLLIEVADGSTLSPLVLDGGAPNDFSNNGAGNGFDGIDIRVHDAGSSADFTFNNLILTGSGGRGLDLDAYDGGELTFNVNGGMISDSGLQGIDINVGQMDEFPMAPVMTAGTFNGTFTDLDVATSGQSGTFSADNINVVYTAGSDGTLTFNNTTANMADGDGIDILINDGSTVVVNVDNGTEANNNANSVTMDAVGLRFTADGAATTASLLMDDTGDINVFNNNEAEGVLVTLTDQVTVPDLEVFAEATMNGADGILIDATDGSGVTINNLDIAGAQANMNAGSGLVVDLNAVNGITDFTLSNATFMDNAGDQVFLGFQDMSLTNLTIDTVTVDGLDAASEDGLEINLNNTDVTNQLLIDTLVATSNGNNGLNLVVFDSNIGDGSFGPVTDQSMGGVITNSTFSSNGDNFDRTIIGQPDDNYAGAQLLFQGTSVVNFDIFDNETGFSNNEGIGLNIQIQDQTQFTMAGDNFNATGQSFYNNNISGNGGFGVLVEASEPNDPNPVDIGDGEMPEYELELGDILEDPNTISGNTDANFALIGSNDSVGSFTIVNSIMNNAVDAAGGDARFAGEGLAIVLEERAELESLTIDGTSAGLTLNGNDGSGLMTSISGSSLLGTTTNMMVLNTTIMDNDVHGIDIRRSGGALYGLNHRVIIGGAGMGNILTGNDADNDGDGNGLNIINTNQSGSNDVPFDLEIVENEFTDNANGLFLNGLADSIFIGNVSDNTFTANRLNGINVQMENTANIGDREGAANPPFVFDGNQITANLQDGILIDTNFTNEQGLFPGTAYANILIKDSDSLIDPMTTNPVRTVISNNLGNGVRILDNSDFSGNGMTATLQNTYDIRATDIDSNAVDGIAFRQGTGAAVNPDAGAALLVGDMAGPATGDNDVRIRNSGDDGIDLIINDGDFQNNTFVVNRTTIFGSGITNADGDGGNGIEVDVTNGGSFLDTSFDQVMISGSNDDGIDFQVTNGFAMTEMFGVESFMNAGRGLDVVLRDSGATTTIWNIGDPSRLMVEDINRFNNNSREGVVFDLQTTTLDHANQTARETVNGPLGGEADGNVDLFVEVNLSGGETSPGQTRRSTLFPAVAGPGLTDTIETGQIRAAIDPQFLMIQETNVRLSSTVQFINNEVADNGTNFEDGLAFGVSAASYLNLNVSGTSFGGNVGNDLRIYPQRSGELNPANSQRDIAGNGIDDGFVVYDPVAYIDFVFGAIDTDNDNIPDTRLGNGEEATTATGGGGEGDQITITTLGTAASAQITNTGLFTNSDPVKGGSRSVALAGQIQALDLDVFNQLNNVNIFDDGNGAQDIGALFNNFGQTWIQNNAQAWPEGFPFFP